MMKTYGSDKKITSEKTGGVHTLFLEDRSKMTLEGVTEVCGFSENLVTLKTRRGALSVKGKGLSISRLNTETGELFISGEIAIIQYSKDKSTGSLFEGLFK